MLQKIKPEVVSFHFRLLDIETLSDIKALGIFVISSATTVNEAKALVLNGADAIIAQGTEAGGHRGTFSEANIHPEHRSALADANDASTVVSKTVTGKPARFIQNRLIKELGQDNEHPLPFQAQSILTTPLAETEDRELMGLYAGQSPALNRSLPTSELVRKMSDETEN